MNARIVRKWSAAIVAFGLVGTGTESLAGSDLHGLTLVSVRAIDPKNPDAEAPWHDRPTLVIRFTAQRDLPAYARQHEYHIGNDASLCSGGAIDPSRPLQNDPYVFDADGKADAFGENIAGGLTDAPGYRVYIAIKPIPLAGRTTFEYDLRSDPEDVCVRLRGGNMTGGSFSSNVLVVPKAAIVAALAQP